MSPLSLWAMAGITYKDFFTGSSPNLGQSQEELFQGWRSFTFDETTDTIDSYVLILKQCAQMLE